MKNRIRPVALAAGLLAFAAASARANLVIVPTFDSTITSDPNAAQIESTINAAIQVYETNFADSVTVNITFAEMNSGLGQSLTYYDDVAYSDVVTALNTQATTSSDATAVTHIPSEPNNPVTNDTLIRSTLANLRALGFTYEDPSPNPDSTISFNIALCNLDRVTIDPSKYDLMAVALHEIDEVLGTSSGINEAEPRVADLFRYDSSGNRTYTTSGDNAYFSLDGTTDLARYNQNPGGDYGDWWSLDAHTPQVQDAFGTAGATPNLGVELTVLDVIGWTRIVPSTLAIQSVAKSGNNLVFTWNSLSGRNYQVQYKTNLLQNSWSNWGAPIAATGPVTSDSVAIGPDPRRFYHVALLPVATALKFSTGQPPAVVKTPKLAAKYFRP